MDNPAIQGLITIIVGVGGCIGYFYFSNQILEKEKEDLAWNVNQMIFSFTSFSDQSDFSENRNKGI